MLFLFANSNNIKIILFQFPDLIFSAYWKDIQESGKLYNNEKESDLTYSDDWS